MMPYIGPHKGTFRRFKFERWCDTRRFIHALRPGRRVVLPDAERSNACASVQRLAAAYSFKRQYRILNWRNGTFIVRRVK